MKYSDPKILLRKYYVVEPRYLIIQYYAFVQIAYSYSWAVLLTASMDFLMLC